MIYNSCLYPALIFQSCHLALATLLVRTTVVVVVAAVVVVMVEARLTTLHHTMLVFLVNALEIFQGRCPLF